MSIRARWEAVPKVVGAKGFSGHVQRTVLEILLGFGLGAFVGFALGLLLGSSIRLRTAYLPFLSALEAIPTVILAPVIIAWFGFGRRRFPGPRRDPWRSHSSGSTGAQQPRARRTA